jgi:hypothetical protein
VKTWEFLTPPPPERRTQSLRPQPPGSALISPSYGHQPPSALQGFEIDPKKLLRRRSSLVVADLPLDEFKRLSVSGHHDDPAIEEEDEGPGTNGTASGMNGFGGNNNSKKKEKPAPTQFKEPDASSLLDSFGF